MVCAKSSAPPSPVVSAASAGALEVLPVHSTNNLPRTLNQAREAGCRVIGAAAASVPMTTTKNQNRNNERKGEVNDSSWDDHAEESSFANENQPPTLFDLQDLPPIYSTDNSKPVLLVLGSRHVPSLFAFQQPHVEQIRFPIKQKENRRHSAMATPVGDREEVIDASQSAAMTVVLIGI